MNTLLICSFHIPGVYEPVAILDADKPPERLPLGHQRAHGGLGVPQAGSGVCCPAGP